MQLEQYKNYLKIDHDFDDDLLVMLINTAEDYIDGAINLDYEQLKKLDKRYEYATALLVSHWYESRSATSEANLNNIPYGVLSLIQQLRYFKNG